MDDRPLWSVEIYGRAAERGEIDLDRIPPAVLAMPFQLIRHDLLMTLRPLTPERIKSIVDDLFLPLVAAADHPIVTYKEHQFLSSNGCEFEILDVKAAIGY